MAKRRRRDQLDADTARAKPVVVRFLRDALGKLRQEYARRLKRIRERDPQGVAELGSALTPCDTCAFRHSADFSDGYDGFLQTSTLLVHALETGARFFCHEPKAAGETGDYRIRKFAGPDGREHGWPCVGWLTLQSPNGGDPLNIRELLGDTVVDLMVEGSEVLNRDRLQGRPLR